MSPILGELMTLIEDRSQASPAARRRPVKIGPNLVLLATCSPTDRSPATLRPLLPRTLEPAGGEPSQLRRGPAGHQWGSNQ